MNHFKLNHLTITFVFYSTIGWLYETFLELFIYNVGFTNRGFLSGTYLPVYGFGSLAIILTLSGLVRKDISIGKLYITPLAVFLGTMVITSGIELGSSYFLEAIRGDWLWNYNHYRFNFNGRIALNPSIRFGMGGLLIMYVLQPKLENFLCILKEKTKNIFAIAFILTMLIDFLTIMID